MNEHDEAEMQKLAADFARLQTVIRRNVAAYHQLVQQLMFGWFIAL